MRAVAVLVILSACGGPPTAAAAPTSTPTTTTTPVQAPTGGSLLIGEIASPKSFDPRPTLLALNAEFVACYNQARIATPSLHGKLKLLIHVNEAGACMGVDAEAGGSANDGSLVACLG